MLIKKGFALLKIISSKSGAYSEEILAISEIENELQSELERYNAENKVALEEYTKTLSEIDSYFRKYLVFSKTLGFSESKRGAGILKRQNYFQANPFPDLIKKYFWLDSDYSLCISELEYPSEYIIREFGFKNG